MSRGAGLMASAVVPPASAVDVLMEPFNNLSAWTIAQDTPTIVSLGRTGNAVQLDPTSLTDLLDYTIPSANRSDTLTIGFAYNTASTATSTIFDLLSDAKATQHNRLRKNSDGSLSFLRGVSAIGNTAAGVIAANTWYYIEVQVKLHDTVGTFEVRVNGTAVLGPTTGQDTKNAGTNTVYETVELSSPGFPGVGKFDDLYITTGAGAFKGPIKIGPDGDTFDRANGAIGSGWFDSGSTAWTVASNKATKINGDHFAKFQTSLGSPDHWVEADVHGIGGAGGNYVVLNARGASNSHANDYMGFIQPGGPAEIGKNVGSGYTTLASGGSFGTADCKLRLEVQGTAIRLYRNGVLALSTTDPSLTTGNFVGFNSFNGGAPGDITYDNFRCGTFPYTP